jgi:hypothetical protein
MSEQFGDIGVAIMGENLARPWRRSRLVQQSIRPEPQFI